MNARRYILCLIACSIVNELSAQSYLDYYPGDWDFGAAADLIDRTQVRSVRTQHFTIDADKEYPVYETLLDWNQTHQLHTYRWVNQLNSDAGFAIAFRYVSPNSNPLQSLRITHPETGQLLEEWQYTNGAFDVAQIIIKRYLRNIPEPDVLRVTYEGNDDDYIVETVYTPQQTIDRQTERWYQRAGADQYRIVKKRYLDPERIHDQTDSLILSANRNIEAHFENNFGITTETRYHYQPRTVRVAGEAYINQELMRISKDGQDQTRYTYTYDDRGNWTARKTYSMKNGKWVYDTLTRRSISYR